MDGDRFDALARLIGSGRSRRGLLKSLAGAAAGVAAAGLGRASAARLRSAGNSCRLNSDCASGLCVQETRTRAICHCRSAADCPAAGDLCHAAVCQPNGYCGTVAANADGVCAAAPDACTTASTCDNAGNCVAGSPVNCNDGNLCTVDSCDPAAGCVHTLVDCNDDNACTIDTCDSAVGCVYTDIVCDDNDLCTVDSCNPAVGCVYTPVDCPECSACDSTTGSCAPAGDGASCNFDNTCCGGECVDTSSDVFNCGGCGVSCFDVGLSDCESSQCCQSEAGVGYNCSASVPCCGGASCNASGYCCYPAGTVTCYTDSASQCCSGTCVPFDSACSGHCPGACG